MGIYLFRIDKHKMFALALILSILNANLFYQQNAAAAITGKTRLLPSTYLEDDAAVVASIGINKKSATSRIGSIITFIPYFYFGQNKGSGGSKNPSDYYATISYELKDQLGRKINVGSGSQEIIGKGSIVQSNLERSIQDFPTGGESVWTIANETGTYSFTAWHDFNENGKLDIGEPSETAYQTVYSTGFPTITLASFGTAIGSMTPGSVGVLTRICITNNYQTTNLSIDETIKVTTNSATEVFDSVTMWKDGFFQSVDVGEPDTYTLTFDNFNDSGCAFINHFNTSPAPGLVTLTFQGSGGQINSYEKSISNLNISITAFPVTSDAARSVTNANNLSGTYSNVNSETAAASGNPGKIFEVGVPVGTTTAVKLSTVTEAGIPNISGKSLLMRVVDTDGKITGLKGGSYVVAVASGSNSPAPYIVESTFYATLNRGESFMVYVQGNDSLFGGVTTGSVAVRVKPQERFAKSFLATPPVIRSKPGDTSVATFYLKDQFNSFLPYSPFIPKLSGRNSGIFKSKAYLSDSLGRIQFELKDTTSDSTSLTDLISGTDLNGVNLLGSNLIINYDDYPEVASIKITGAASEDAPGQFTKNYIDTSYAGASNTTVPIFATLLDGNGKALPEGLRVNWSIKGLDGKSFIPTDTISGIDYTATTTNALGQAMTYVYSWATGVVEVHASFEGVNSAIPGKINFVNSPSDTRVVSATFSQGFIRAHVEDRYGNPVQGVDLTISRKSGSGYIAGVTSTRVSALTNKEGNIEFAVIGGDATFEISTTLDEFGQTTSEAGYVYATSVSTASAGGTLAPAGVSKVTIDVKSKDQNAEALAANKVAVDAADKANAASNLAAEKADNAILKAQEVQEAVAELATKTLVSVKALRAQMDKIYAIILKISKKIG